MYILKMDHIGKNVFNAFKEKTNMWTNVFILFLMFMMNVCVRERERREREKKQIVNQILVNQQMQMLMHVYQI